MTEKNRIKPRVCVCITGSTEEEILREAGDAVSPGGDMLEWRGDFLSGISPEGAMRISGEIKALSGGIPLIFTMRSEDEGEYIRVCEAVLKAGHIDFLDVDFSKTEESVEHLISQAHEKGISVILSMHIFSHTPSSEELSFISDRMRSFLSEGDIMKVCAMACDMADVRRILALSLRNRTSGIRGIYISMGEKGMITRVIGEFTGMPFMYSCISRENACAGGQFSTGEQKRVNDIIHSFLTHSSFSEELC